MYTETPYLNYVDKINTKSPIYHTRRRLPIDACVEVELESFLFNFVQPYKAGVCLLRRQQISLNRDL